MKWIVLLLIVVSLGYYGITPPNGTHYHVGFGEDKGLHMHMDKGK